MTTYLKTFKTESAAIAFATMKNRASAKCQNPLAVVNGPEDDFCVVDLKTAIDLRTGYKLNFR